MIMGVVVKVLKEPIVNIQLMSEIYIIKIFVNQKLLNVNIVVKVMVVVIELNVICYYSCQS